jgi:3-oxoacyl-[acyl-carrier protein] reductase
MAGRLNGKSAIVTGGSRGIGAGIAERLASEGAQVAITYTSRPDAAGEVVGRIAAAGGKAFAVQANAADPEAGGAALAAAAERLGGLDILVHNAGVAQFAPIDQADFHEFRRQFGVNVDGVYAGTRAVLPQLRDGGRIIVIGSVNAHTVPIPGGAIYGATKAAVAGLVRGWARDLGPRGILVNAVQPGPVDTDLNPATGDFAEMLTKLTALGRYGRVEEIAALTAFLASDEASYITGTTIDIDGGMTI